MRSIACEVLLVFGQVCGSRARIERFLGESFVIFVICVIEGDVASAGFCIFFFHGILMIIIVFVVFVFVVSFFLALIVLSEEDCVKTIVIGMRIMSFVFLTLLLVSFSFL